MKHIHVELGKDSYDIHIENGLLDRAGDYIRSLTKSKTLAVITDSHVDALCRRLENSCRRQAPGPSPVFRLET